MGCVMTPNNSRARLWAALACLVAAMFLSAAVNQQAGQAQQQKQEPEKEKPKPEEKEKKPGGLFGGVRAVTGMKGSEESQLTASAGAKGVGEGRAIGSAVVGNSDREKVARMASAMPSPAEMKAFLEEGRLSTERKGGQK